MAVPPETTYQPVSELVFTELDEQESVLLNLDTRQYYSLNVTGTRIWELITEGESTRSVVDTIAEEWDLETESAKQHVQSLLNELEEEGLLEKQQLSH